MFIFFKYINYLFYPFEINLSFDKVRRTFLADSLGVSPTPPYI